MKNGRIQAKDISDFAMLKAVYDASVTPNRYSPRASPRDPRWVFWHELAEGAMNHVPAKVIISKWKQLMKRGFCTGCTCGCRGDFELLPRGLAFLEEKMEIGRFNSGSLAE